MNAFTGSVPVTGHMSFHSQWLDVITGKKRERAAERLPDLRDWRNPRVGWGLILPENPNLPLHRRACADDAPPSIRKLVAARGHDGHPAPVFRYVPDLPQRFSTLRCYRVGSDLSLNGSDRGVEEGEIPHYLLIYGSPARVSWGLQFVLQTNRCVGRLDLSEDEGLDRYVEALMKGWSGSGRRVDRPLVWAVDDHATPITKLMRDTVAAPLAQRLKRDPELKDGVRFIDGTVEYATAAVLREGLAELHPALVVTTSHGYTLPLDDSAMLAAQLGLLVGLGGSADLVKATDVLGEWQPDGAIWFAQACCSAGADRPSRYLKLLDAGSLAYRVLAAVAETGPLIAPFPRALLGAERPLAAFIGHVEPTFDWTLREPRTQQYLTGGLKASLHARLYQSEPVPVGFALQAWYERIGSLLAAYEEARRAIGDAGPSAEMIVDLLSAQDVESLVILGDPTVTLRPAS